MSTVSDDLKEEEGSEGERKEFEESRSLTESDFELLNSENFFERINDAFRDLPQLSSQSHSTHSLLFSQSSKYGVDKMRESNSNSREAPSPFRYVPSQSSVPASSLVS
jgi:hypothetical protein